MRDPWVRWSILWLGAITLVSLAIGFLWLPSAQADFTVKGIWDGICRAAGVPAEWGSREAAPAAKPSTAVVLTSEMARAGSAEAVGRGASLALAQCTMVHFEDNWEHRRVPVNNDSKEKSVASMQRVADLLARENAQLWINHDKAQRDSLRMSPQYYE